MEHEEKRGGAETIRTLVKAGKYEFLFTLKKNVKRIKSQWKNWKKR